MACDIGAAAYFETSALTQQGLKEAFDGALRLLVSKPSHSKSTKGGKKVGSKKKKITEKSCRQPSSQCCLHLCYQNNNLPQGLR